MDWHTKSKEEILKELNTSENGLSKQDAEKRLKKYGLNEISKKKKTSQILIFLKQFNSPLIYILFIAMVISFVFNHLVDAYVILAIVLINASISFIEERKAERAIDALKKMVVSYAKIFRGNQMMKLPASQLVPGDIIFLEEGDKTEIGKVAESIQEIVQPKMHFNEKVSQLAFQMAVFAIIGAGLTFVIGYFIEGLI